MAELIDLNGEFDLGNKFTLNVATKFSQMLDDSYRVIVKYGNQKLPKYVDDKLNILISTSRENHQLPVGFFRDDVFLIFQHYHPLGKWGEVVHNPLTFPIPLGSFNDDYHDIEIKPLSQRKYDFTFIGQIPHTGTRDGFKRCLDKMLEETGDKFKHKVIYTDGFCQGLESKEYMEILADSRLSLCPTGACSPETFRFFESLMMGAIPVVESLPQFWYYEKATFFRGGWQFLDNTLSKALNLLQTAECKPLLYGLASYNNTVLSVDGLAHKMTEMVKARHLNLESSKEYLENLRDKFKNELDADELQDSL
jgi:hypothetical protein